MRRVLVTALSVAALLAAAMTGPAQAAKSRGLSVPLKTSESANAPIEAEVELYGSSYALVIGIDDYTTGWPKLDLAVKDAKAVAKELRLRGFEVTFKQDLTSEQLRQTLRRFFAIKGRDPDARLFLWWAGHGHTIAGEGYLVPTDAPPANDPDFLVKALHMRDFGGLMRLAQAKHVLSVFDSCFSGTIFTARAGAAPAAITRKTTKPVRQFITSGDAGQEVRDDGSFREYFLRAIRGDERADFNKDGYVTGQELGLFMNQKVSELTRDAQTPKAGKLHDVKYNQGDFVFALLGPQKKAPSRAPASGASTFDQRQLDLSFWQTIKDSNNAAMYQEYLWQFPNGTFSGLAKLKLNQLKKRTRLQTRKKKPVVDEKKLQQKRDRERERLAAKTRRQEELKREGLRKAEVARQRAAAERAFQKERERAAAETLRQEELNRERDRQAKEARMRAELKQEYDRLLEEQRKLQAELKKERQRVAAEAAAKRNRARAAAREEARRERERRIEEEEERELDERDAEGW